MVRILQKKKFGDIENLILVRGIGDGTPYVEFIFADKRPQVYGRQVSFWQNELCKELFFRVNKSYLVNRNYIVEESNSTVKLSNGLEIKKPRQQIRKEVSKQLPWKKNLELVLVND